MFLSGDSGNESKFIQAAGKIRFVMVIGLRSLWAVSWPLPLALETFLQYLQETLYISEPAMNACQILLVLEMTSSSALSWEKALLLKAHLVSLVSLCNRVTFTGSKDFGSETSLGAYYSV